MKIAIPCANGVLCTHFGHCREFALISVSQVTRTISGTAFLTPPAHEPGVLPKWLHEQGVNVIIAGGMGMRAQQFFSQYGIRVVTGAPAGEPAGIAKQWLEGSLSTGENVCDH